MDLKHLLDFLKRLKKNNNKEWFDKNKKEYEALRKEWVELVEGQIQGIQKFDPTIAGIQAKDCLFRINRDIRFSKDKSPYKTNFSAYISPGGKNSFKAGYYFHVQPGECFVAGGVYVPEPNVLSAVRQEIDYNFDEFKKILSHKDFKKYFGDLSGEKLVRPPKGYEADNPAIEYIKHKSFLAHSKVDEAIVTGKGYGKHVTDTFKAMYPLLHFLNRGIE